VPHRKSRTSQVLLQLCRTVTILFCDVKGSTAMTEDLDPEDVIEIMDGAFDVVIEPH
jgi:class 3 adenylate cyclase